MLPSSTSTSPALRTSKMLSSRAAPCSNSGLISSAPRRAFTGGPSAFINVEGLGGTDITGHANNCIRCKNLTQLYGMTQADYERMSQEQGGRCACCGGPSTNRGDWRKHP